MAYVSLSGYDSGHLAAIRTGYKALDTVARKIGDPAGIVGENMGQERIVQDFPAENTGVVVAPKCRWFPLDSDMWTQAYMERARLRQLGHNSFNDRLKTMYFKLFQAAWITDRDRKCRSQLARLPFNQCDVPAPSRKICC